MIRIINGLKYDTNKMELISRYTYRSLFMCGKISKRACTIYKSKKGRYLKIDNDIWIPITEDDAKRLLMSHDATTYEKIFGEVEEA